MVDRRVIAARLEKLREYVGILDRLRKTPVDQFKQQVAQHGLAERYLHLSIECLLDIGTHIIASMGYPTPRTYDEVFQILGQQRVIPEGFVPQLAGLAGFRNILVHEYLDIDLDIVHAHLQRIEVFDEFARHIAAFLEGF